MTRCEFVISGQSSNWQKSVFNSELQKYIKKYKKPMCLDLVVEVYFVVWFECSPSNLNNFILIELHRSPF